MRRAFSIDHDESDLINCAVFASIKENFSDNEYYTENDAVIYEKSAIQTEIALTLNPSKSSFYHALGVFLRNLGDFSSSERVIRRGLLIDPSDRNLKEALSYAMMSRLDYRSGLYLFEERLSHPKCTVLGLADYIWNGCSIKYGSLFIWKEGGFGDVFQMLRYLPAISRRCVRVIIHCDPKISKIVSGSIGYGRVEINPDDRSDISRVVSFLSLPFVFGTEIETIPSNIPYIFADKILSAQWGERMQYVRGFRVGVSWHTDTDPTRRFPLSSLSPVASVPGVSLVALQKGAALAEAASLDWEASLTIFPEMDEGDHAFMDTAAIIDNLDLVLTNDTSVAHLAGAMGAPVWLCVGKSPDWRWGETGASTPWYPTMRIFRAKHLWRWDDVFRDVAKEIAVLVGRNSERE